MQSTIAQLLSEAREAYHLLMTGRSVVMVKDQNGETVQYTQVNANKLQDYITSLEDKLNPHSRVNRPMRPWF